MLNFKGAGSDGFRQGGSGEGGKRALGAEPKTRKPGGRNMKVPKAEPETKELREMRLRL